MKKFLGDSNLFISHVLFSLTCRIATRQREEKNTRYNIVFFFFALLDNSSSGRHVGIHSV